MSSLPYMQLYVSDYLADTAHLNAAQNGAYLLLLMNYWQRGKPLDNTGDRLAFVAKMTPEEWEDNREILAEFFWVDGDIWTHARVENDLAKVREKSEQSSYAGKMSAIKRKTNDRSTTAESDLDSGLTDEERSVNHKDKDKDKDKETTYTFDLFWNTYPIKIGKATAVKAWAKALKRASGQIIIEGADRYAKDPNRDPQFTAHPATWLNGDRWLDAPLPQKRASAGFREPNPTPTIVPPRFVADGHAVSLPMPEDVKAIFEGIRRNS
jgi:uncharacterized protein YdaU (DUF1376 family)